MKDILTIDGSHGEGRGQILRSALALSLLTGTPFRLVHIRAGRTKPGLMRQHLTAVQAAAAVGGAHVEGAVVGSREIVFHPGAVQNGSYTFAVGTAGSATLVLQTVLPALLAARGPSTVAIEGGTHNPYAPPYDFLERTFVPVLGRMGAQIDMALDCYGFYPAGGGRMTVHVQPAPQLQPVHLVERGGALWRRVRAVVSHLPVGIAQRELAVMQTKFSWPDECFAVEDVRNSRGPGNILFVELAHEHMTEVITGFGEAGVPAEAVATATAKHVRQYLASSAPVCMYLADQLLLPFAMAGGGSFRSVAVSRHAQTSMDVIRRFLPVQISAEPSDGGWMVRVQS